MILTAQIVVSVSLLVGLVHWKTVGWSFAPAGTFLVFNYVATISIIRAASNHRETDMLYVAICAYAFVAFLLSAAIAARNSPLDAPYRTVRTVPVAPIVVLAVFGAVIVAAYYSAVGYSALFEGLKASVSGDDTADIAGLRLESYSGTRYLFPGYVNQFKNAIFPACVVLLIGVVFKRADSKLILAPPLILAAGLALMGTGQRQALILFVITVLILTVARSGKLFNLYGTITATIGLAALTIGTFALGRGNAEVQIASTFTEKIGILLSQIASRVFDSGAEGMLIGFEYIYREKPIAYGTEWAQSVIGILPGDSGSTLASEIFEQLWGSTRGNSPPGIWASVYHNFGHLGVALIPIVLGVTYAAIGRWIATTLPRCSALGAIGLAGVIVSLGFWSSGSPVAILNAGVFAYLLLVWIDLKYGKDTEISGDKKPISASP